MASTAPGIGSPETWSTPSTSSRMAAMERESIRVTRSVVLPLAEIEYRFSRSSGPGGQHANTSETRVEALLDVESSAALTDGQKRRVLAKAGPTLRAVAQDERSQLRNRELATERLVEQLRAALKVERKRVPTRPSQAAKQRRLESKKRRAATKKLRRPPVGIDSEGGRAPARERCSRRCRRSAPACSTTSAASAARSGRSRLSSPTRSPTT